MAKQATTPTIVHTITIGLTQEQFDAILITEQWKPKVTATMPDGTGATIANPVTQADVVQAYYDKRTEEAEAQQDRMLGKQAMQEFIEQRRRARKRRREG